VNRVRVLALLHQADFTRFIVIGGSAVLLHWHEKGGLSFPDLQPRPTIDIDLAVVNQELSKSLVGMATGTPVEVLRMLTEDGQRCADFTFKDYITVDLDGVKVQVAGVAALFVMKTFSADAPGRFTKRGSDLRDLYSLLRLYGAMETVHLFTAHDESEVIAETVKHLRQMLAHEGSRGYKWLFEEMNLMDAEGIWVRAAFDQFFNELQSAGFALE
jgi:hypothetical protein